MTPEDFRPCGNCGAAQYQHRKHPMVFDSTIGRYVAAGLMCPGSEHETRYSPVLGGIAATLKWRAVWEYIKAWLHGAALQIFPWSYSHLAWMAEQQAANARERN